MANHELVNRLSSEALQTYKSLEEKAKTNSGLADTADFYLHHRAFIKPEDWTDGGRGYYKPQREQETFSGLATIAPHGFIGVFRAITNRK